ncbi:MAG: hypothetical protein KY449_13910, partial [Proteobacteria bacterium]|nr:hypothetical protein [Pseudomonadota bacterium]
MHYRRTAQTAKVALLLAASTLAACQQTAAERSALATTATANATATASASSNDRAKAAKPECVDPAVVEAAQMAPPNVKQAVGGAMAATAGQAAGAAVAGPLGAAVVGAVAGVLGRKVLAKRTPH